MRNRVNLLLRNVVPPLLVFVSPFIDIHKDIKHACVLWSIEVNSAACHCILISIFVFLDKVETCLVLHHLAFQHSFLHLLLCFLLDFLL